MKASAWNSSRVTPTITNFLVLMFSMIAPAMAKEANRAERGGGKGRAEDELGRSAPAFQLPKRNEKKKKKIRSHMIEPPSRRAAGR